MMEPTRKEFYEAPSTRVFEVKQEGMICASGEKTNWDGDYDDYDG